MRGEELDCIIITDNPISNVMTHVYVSTFESATQVSRGPSFCLRGLRLQVDRCPSERKNELLYHRASSAFSLGSQSRLVLPLGFNRDFSSPYFRCVVSQSERRNRAWWNKSPRSKSGREFNHPSTGKDPHCEVVTFSTLRG